MDEDLDDFLAPLAPEQRPLPALAELLEPQRQPLARWCAAAFVARLPERVALRGAKGVRLIEVDADALLRQLVVAARHPADLSAARRHARWFAEVVRSRAGGAAATATLAPLVDLLAEALLRWFGGPGGGALAATLLDIHGLAPPVALAPWLTGMDDAEQA